MVQNTARAKSKATFALGILLLAIVAVSVIAATSILKNPQTAVAQPFAQTVKYRDLVIDLGNGIQTNAQLTIPAFL
jgi:hypothetical protein